ncbi:hypothetical protein ACQ4M4_25345 [Leptolyngbya sp. AN02str]|uniref:hypothetical protein n=1 Tax=Leptolyngbya sp. AN02str TaxID=3423363 RepID=UPI003D32239A
MAPTQPWQDHLAPSLVQRLWRPIAQPGAMDGQMVETLFHRYYQFLPPAPLLQQALHRRDHLVAIAPEMVPIVYAQPWVSAGAPSSATDIATQNDLAIASASDDSPNLTPAVSPISLPGQATFIQAKLDPAVQPSSSAVGDWAIAPSTQPKPAQPSPPSQIIQARLTPAARATSKLAPLPLTVAPALPVVKPTLTQSPLAAKLAASQPVMDAPLLPRVVALPAPVGSPERKSVGAIAPTPAPPVVQPRPIAAAPVLALHQRSPAFTLPLAQSASTSRVSHQADRASEQVSLSRSAPAILNTGVSGTLPVVSGQPMEGRSLPVSAPTPAPAVDIVQLADQVERRLKRNLIIDRERRGWQS